MTNMTIDLRLGDCLEVLKTIPDNSVDSVVTDPPYGIGFMNKEWDNPQKHQELIEREKERSIKRFEEGKSPAKAGFSTGVQPGLPIGGAKEGKWFQDWCELWARECFRILKPGGHALSFSAPRTYHRMATAFEDSGFQIRDQIMWVFGSGFPKSHNIGKAIKEENDWTGWGTALKPAHEPIVMARKPISEKSIAENVLKHGTGGINIDGSRIEMKDKENINFDRPRVRESVNPNWILKQAHDYTDPQYKEYNEQGRFPANIIFDEEAGQLLDEQSGPTSQGHWAKTKTTGFGEFGNGKSEYKGVGPKDKNKEKGGASRFFYCPKAAKKDRNEGLDDFEEKIKSGAEFRPNHMEKALEGEDGNPFGRWGKIKNNHPTVKPTDLMRYLINLVTPPNGTILDPFMGSGSTGKAAVRCGVNFIGIEKEQEYMDIASARIEHERNKPTQTKLF
jgi:DNA modification methylase